MYRYICVYIYAYILHTTKICNTYNDAPKFFLTFTSIIHTFILPKNTILFKKCIETVSIRNTYIFILLNNGKIKEEKPRSYNENGSILVEMEALSVKQKFVYLNGIFT